MVVFMNIGYNGHNSASNNISNSQYLGGSFNESNQNAYNMAFPTTRNNVQSLHLNQSSLKLNFKYNSEDIHDKYASERTTTNCGTYLRLQLGGRLKGQSNVFKTPQVNLWKPVQRQPCVAEESRDLSLYRKRKQRYWISWLNYETSATQRQPCVAKESRDLSLYRKRKCEILDFLGESWEEGTLFDVLRPFYKLPRLEEYSNKSNEDLSAVKTKPLAMFSGTKGNIIITEGATGSNEQISKGLKGMAIILQKMNSMNHPRSGSGHIKIQSVSLVDYEIVSESESIETQTACFDDNSLGSGSGNMKIPSVSSVDCEMVSESKNTEAQIACFDDISSGSG
ncbi:hypothetical protein Tco_0744769 [Tanacetum coccineum]